MSKYKVLVLPSAEKEIAKLTKIVQRKIIKVLLQLADNPRPANCKKLVGTNAWRIRVGDYRIVFSIEDGILTIEVIRVAPVPS